MDATNLNDVDKLLEELKKWLEDAKKIVDDNNPANGNEIPCDKPWCEQVRELLVKSHDQIPDIRAALQAEDPNAPNPPSPITSPAYDDLSAHADTCAMFPPMIMAIRQYAREAVVAQLLLLNRLEHRIEAFQQRMKPSQ
jgi:hypothetical protein